MSATTSCTPCCTTPQTVNTPGVAGAAAITVTTASFVIPAVGSTVVVSVGDTSMFASGQNVYVGAANFTITALSSTSLTLKYLGLPADTAAGSTVVTNSTVGPGLGNYVVPVALNTVAQITDNSTGSATDTVAAGAGVQTISIPVQLVSLTTAALDLVTTYTPGYKFKILKLDFVTTTLGTGGGATQSISLAISGVSVTGGVVVPTLAGTTPMGVKTIGSAVTGLNTGSSTDTISIKVAAGGTVFSAGAGVLLLELQNMDTAGAIASIIAKVSALQSALT